MKNKIILFISLSAMSLSAIAAEPTNRLDRLGGNEEIIRRARELDPKNRMRVVQKREVDRSWRLELGVNYGSVLNGDPYLTTNSFGATVDLHITPHWSVGARYYDHYNELTPEGERVYKNAQANATLNDLNVFPALDYPLSSTLGVISFYPLYGKLNLFDLTTAQFDIYVLGGFGQTELNSGSAPTWTAGGGVGMWLSQHFSSRLEMRYQNYEDQVNGGRNLDLIISTFSIGMLL